MVQDQPWTFINENFLCSYKFHLQKGSSSDIFLFLQFLKIANNQQGKEEHFRVVFVEPNANIRNCNFKMP
jgi:hypothetical protein